jgi:hypothetical protein
MGGSSSKSTSEQSADLYMSQQFSGTCNVTCDNTIDNLSIDIINTTVGGDISVNQSCSTNAQCLIGSTSDATSDVMFAAANSSNATDAGSILNPLNFDKSVSDSRQSIKISNSQATSEQCNVSSINQMSNVTIFAANSTIGGSISINQQGSTQGNCQLTNSMSAAAYASGQASNESKSGKDKKAGKFTFLTYLVIGIVVIVIVSIIAKVMAGKSKQSEMSAEDMALAQARAAAGCPGGGKPVMDPRTNKPFIDPRTKGPICPPPPLFPPRAESSTTSTTASSSQPINIVIDEYSGNGGSNNSSRGSRTVSRPSPSGTKAASVRGIPKVSTANIPSLPDGGLIES